MNAILYKHKFLAMPLPFIIIAKCTKAMLLFYNDNTYLKYILGYNVMCRFKRVL